MAERSQPEHGVIGNPTATTRIIREGFLGNRKPVESQKQRVVVGKAGNSIATGPDNLLSVIGDDERTRQRETEELPFRMICALEIDGEFDVATGTGWLVGPRTVATAGHCILEAARIGRAERIRVTPGLDGEEPAPFGSFASTRFSIPKEWEEGEDKNYDFGVIHLNEPIGEALGWFAVASLPDCDLRDAMVNISGYPSRPGSGRQQWWAMNRINALTPLRIFYDVDTSKGQSGAPVYIYEADALDAPIVIGVHAYGTGGTPEDLALTANSAPRLTPQAVQQIVAWIEEAGAPAERTAPAVVG